MIEADEACDKAASELEKGREARSNKMSEKQRETFVRRRAERADAWVEQLPIQASQSQTPKQAKLPLREVRSIRFCIPAVLPISPHSMLDAYTLQPHPPHPLPRKSDQTEQDQKMFSQLRTQWLKHDNITVHPTHKVRTSSHSGGGLRLKI